MVIRLWETGEVDDKYINVSYQNMDGGHGASEVMVTHKNWNHKVLFHPSLVVLSNKKISLTNVIIGIMEL